MQVLDDYGNSPNASKAKQRAGDLYNIVAGTEHNTKKAGEWNQVEVICKDGQVKIYQNGANTITVIIGDDHWRSLVIDGYGDKRPSLAVEKSGRIDLQDAGDEMWYRNIKIKKLNNQSVTQEKTEAVPPAPNNPLAIPKSSKVSPTASAPKTNRNLLILLQLEEIPPISKMILQS